MQISRGLVFEIASLQPNGSNPTHLPQVTGLWVKPSASALQLALWEGNLFVSDLLGNCVL